MSRKHRAKTNRHDLRPSGWELVIPSWLSCLIICTVGVLVYSNTFQSSFHFDDETSIVNNLAIRDLSDWGAIFRYSSTRFVTYLSFALNYRVQGLAVAGYHVVNIAIHLINGLMVWLFIRQMVRTPLLKGTPLEASGSLLSLAGALVFLLHPLQTQSVTYIAQRSASLAALFYCAALWLYGEARALQIAGGSRLPTVLCFAGAAMAGMLGLFTKETALTLPFAIALYEFHFFNGRRRIKWGHVVAFTVFFVGIPAYLVIRGFVNLDVAGALPVLQYLLTQPSVWLTYLRLLVFPVGQNLDYDFPVSHSVFEPLTALGIVVIGLAGIAGYKLFRNHRILSFGIVWFFLTLLPESSILPLPDVIFEHRLYLPMLGFAIFAAFLVYELTTEWDRWGLYAMIAIVFGALGVATFTRNEVWKDDVSLWTDVVAKSPKKARGYLNLARAYSDRGLLNLASDNLQRAFLIDPTNADIFGNRASILIQQSRPDDAIAQCNRAMALGGGLRYQLARIYFSRGTAYLLKNSLDSALTDLSSALSLDPNHETAYFNRGLIYGRRGESQRALDDYSRCLTLNPSNAKALNNRGAIYRETGRLNEALADFDNAVDAQREFPAAYLNRGMVRNLKGQLDQAIEDFSYFISVSPKNFDGYYNRGATYLRKQEFVKAVSDFNRAFMFNPSYGPTFIDRARAYIALQQFAAAENDLKRAQSLGVRVDPSLIEAAKKGMR